jgi:superfamily II DNA/RNA helicase
VATFESLEHIVVDEGDKMSEMGLLDEIKWVYENNRKVHKYFFSATF